MKKVMSIVSVCLVLTCVMAMAIRHFDSNCLFSWNWSYNSD